MSKNSGAITNGNALKNEKEQIVEIGVDKLEKFPKHPFKVEDGTLTEIMESITSIGITTPLVVREKDNGNYEIISGHRRKRACELLGIKDVPCVIRNLSDDEAIITMVDSNIQREEVLFSEKAFAYKMKLEAMSRQGKRTDLTSNQVGGKLNERESAYKIGQDIGESATQIRRYIRLTELIPDILKMVDEKQISFNPAVELSYLTKEEQTNLLDAMDCFEATPSLAQAIQLKKMSQQGQLDSEKIDEIMGVEKPNQIPKYEITYKRFEDCIPRDVVTPREVEDYLYRCALTCKQMRIPLMDIKNKEVKKNKDRDAR